MLMCFVSPGGLLLQINGDIWLQVTENDYTINLHIPLTLLHTAFSFPFSFQFQMVTKVKFLNKLFYYCYGTLEK